MQIVSVVDGTLFATTWREAFALNVDDGQRLWTVELPKKSRLTANALTEQHMLVATLNRVLVIDRQTGALVHDVELPAVMVHKYVFGGALVPSTDGTFAIMVVGRGFMDSPNDRVGPVIGRLDIVKGTAEVLRDCRDYTVNMAHVVQDTANERPIALVTIHERNTGGYAVRTGWYLDTGDKLAAQATQDLTARWFTETAYHVRAHLVCALSAIGMKNSFSGVVRWCRPNGSMITELKKSGRMVLERVPC